MMQEFLALIREVKQLRSDVDKELGQALHKFMMAGAVMDPQAVRMIENLKLYSVSAVSRDKNVMGVHIPEFDIKQEESDDMYPWWATSPELDSALVYFRKVLPRLMKLAAQEKAADLLAQEIETTRRRVNALEHVLIPQLQTTAKYIQMKLEEQGRTAIVTTMKVKQAIVD